MKVKLILNELFLALPAATGKYILLTGFSVLYSNNLFVLTEAGSTWFVQSPPDIPQGPNLLRAQSFGVNGERS